MYISTDAKLDAHNKKDYPFSLPLIYLRLTRLPLIFLHSIHLSTTLQRKKVERKRGRMIHVSLAKRGIKMPDGFEEVGSAAGLIIFLNSKPIFDINHLRI